MLFFELLCICEYYIQIQVIFVIHNVSDFYILYFLLYTYLFLSIKLELFICTNTYKFRLVVFFGSASLILLLNKFYYSTVEYIYNIEIPKRNW